jgi:NTP pyrophosphatase (non-canonical NTP hydrolase)
MEVKQIMKEIHENNVIKGFWEDKETKNVGEVLMLCVSELSEALEAHRKNKFANIKSFEMEKRYQVHGDKLNFEQSFQSHIKDSFEDEIADTVIRLFDLSEGFGIDLEWHIRQKIDYNKTRPFKHNKKY